MERFSDTAYTGQATVGEYCCTFRGEERVGAECDGLGRREGDDAEGREGEWCTMLFIMLVNARLLHVRKIVKIVHEKEPMWWRSCGRKAVARRVGGWAVAACRLSACIRLPIRRASEGSLFPWSSCRVEGRVRWIKFRLGGREK